MTERERERVSGKLGSNEKNRVERQFMRFLKKRQKLDEKGNRKFMFIGDGN